MTPRSASLGPLILLLAVSIVGPAAALAQTAAPRATPSESAPAASSQAASSQPAPSQAAPSRSAAGQAAAGQPPAKTARPAAAIEPNAPAATVGASAAPTQAAPAHTGPTYDVEIVIFRARAALGQPENWSAETNAGATVAGGETASGAGTVGKLLGVLPASDYHLTSLYSRLRSSGTYTPVAHAAWVQTASAWGTRAWFSLQSLGIDVPGLTGVIFLERGEFLHLGMTLDYTMQNPPPGLKAAPGTTFVMNETRRVRFFQRNYYDHPAFGVIALVTPARGSRPPGR